MIACAHCENAPERREDPASGRALYVCPVCTHRGSASTSETYAAATWSKANDPALPRHGCDDGLPRFYQKAGLWGARCEGCGQGAHGYHSLEGAIAGWRRMLRR